MRYTQYLKHEKHIAASDTGGILERWRYGRRLVMDQRATTPKGNLKHGVLQALLAKARAKGYKLSEREIQRRLQCARTYETEAEIRQALADFETWWELSTANFPAIEAPAEGEPYDPRNAEEKWHDFKKAMERRQEENSGQLMFDLDLPHFPHDTYGPRTPVSSLIAACDESERYTDNMHKRDAERRAYVDELVIASEGDLEMAWIEAEARRRGLESLGLTSWDEFNEILGDFRGSDAPEDGSDADEDADEDE